MRIELTHKRTGKSAVLDNTGADSNVKIKIETDDPNLLIILTKELRIDEGTATLDIRQNKDELPSSKRERFINKSTRIVEKFSNEYFNDVFLPSMCEFFDVRIVSEW